jgi:transcriptional regulator with XRE-family HTH domain
VAGDEVLTRGSSYRQAPEGGWVTMSAEEGSSMAIGQIIRQVRERKTLSQDELALRLRDVAANDGQHPQTTRRTISRWERDSRIPQPAYRRWLAVALDLPVETLNRAVAASQSDVPSDARAVHDDSFGAKLLERDETVLSCEAGFFAHLASHRPRWAGAQQLGGKRYRPRSGDPHRHRRGWLGAPNPSA